MQNEILKPSRQLGSINSSFGKQLENFKELMDTQKQFSQSIEGFGQIKLINEFMSGGKDALSSVTFKNLGINMESMDGIMSLTEKLKKNPLDLIGSLDLDPEFRGKFDMAKGLLNNSLSVLGKSLPKD